MEENFVLNGNKLIAEFMGTTYEQKKNTHGMVLYAISWDWLMPVVKKISQDLPEYTHITWEYISDKMIYSELAFATNDISKVFKAVVEFIKWYNENRN